ncbi:unnamed protein product [Pleuronectes platessa]|uniref:Uncharacterized protein n=1 Tax=Pleuronectes platessa TaxID=8262 RepID=A0A9N7YQJ2_PLEPL|nr:unnamed protein product [Pleuronectes platessa]
MSVAVRLQHHDPGTETPGYSHRSESEPQLHMVERSGITPDPDNQAKSPTALQISLEDGGPCGMTMRQRQRATAGRDREPSARRERVRASSAHESAERRMGTRCDEALNSAQSDGGGSAGARIKDN